MLILPTDPENLFSKKEFWELLLVPPLFYIAGMSYILWLEIDKGVYGTKESKFWFLLFFLGVLGIVTTAMEIVAFIKQRKIHFDLLERFGDDYIELLKYERIHHTRQKHILNGWSGFEEKLLAQENNRKIKPE